MYAGIHKGNSLNQYKHLFILVILLGNEKYISKSSFLYRERIKLFVLVKLLFLLWTVLCVAVSQTEIKLLADKIVLMALPFLPIGRLVFVFRLLFCVCSEKSCAFGLFWTER